MAFLHIGIDDTDSPHKGCTTYVATVLVERLVSLGVSFVDYPNLVRLNPNVPWKTRGNGALCLRIKCAKDLVGEVKEKVLQAVEELSDFQYAGTDPGVVFFCDERIPRKIREFARQTIQSVVKLSEALRLVKQFGAEAVGYKNGRGIIGALAAVGETLLGDHTYELIAYRLPENCGTKRRVDAESVKRMDKATAPYTFNNIDLETGRVLITPRGPDPILFGIRGENPEIVKEAFSMIHFDEPIERWTVFRTNHGTDAHLRRVKNLSDVQPYHPVIAKGKVVKAPWIVPRRHVIFSIEDKSGRVDCAAYEPTSGLRKAAKELIIGDLVEVYGGVRPASKQRPITINLEKFRALKLAPQIVLSNPLCPRCKRRMSSLGKKQGFRCDKCGFKDKYLKKERSVMKRVLERGRLYITAPHSQRHLTKPYCRYGQEKTPNQTLHTIIREWHSP